MVVWLFKIGFTEPCLIWKLNLVIWRKYSSKSDYIQLYQPAAQMPCNSGFKHRHKCKSQSQQNLKTCMGKICIFSSCIFSEILFANSRCSLNTKIIYYYNTYKIRCYILLLLLSFTGPSHRYSTTTNGFSPNIWVSVSRRGENETFGKY